ncbi:L-asparaginase [Phyllosticta citribraziliensis]|uniref:asparaginase n=1 Tax=Phyllosticta citribraziliensis TaxID=989973 RepID=A0ABR1MAL0_9PEZI
MKLTILLFAAFCASAADLPHVTIIATGGTIAGVQKSSTSTTNYKDSELAVDALIDAVPEVKDLAQINGVQFSNIGSENMNTSLLLRLSKLVTTLISNGSAEGIVITHGTDTLEESAFFLDVTYDMSAPVAMVAAMRPSTALSADGPFNIYEAVALASSKTAINRGVMMTLNDRIGSAVYTTKTNTRSVDTFKAVEQGYLGVFNDKTPVFYYYPARAYKKPFFDISGVDSLPKVDILYGHIDSDVTLVNNSISNGAKGIVVACTGDGSLPTTWKEIAKYWTESGVPIMRSSRTGSSYVAPGKDNLTLGEYSYLNSGNYNPQKARILLQLVLNEFGGSNSSLVQKFFDPY